MGQWGKWEREEGWIGGKKGGKEEINKEVGDEKNLRGRNHALVSLPDAIL